MTNALHAAKPFAAKPALPETPRIRIRKVAVDAPWAWLDAGWEDLWAAPRISLAYGAVFAVFAYVAALELTRFDALSLLLPLAFGFLLMGPVFAAGLYQISRLRERGEPITFRGVVRAEWAGKSQLASFGMLLFLFYFFWMNTALLLFMLFFGRAGFPPVDQFFSALLNTDHGLGLLLTGTVAGAVFAAAAFSISVIAVPLMFDRKVDAVTAMMASARAVWKNLPAMALWAGLIVLMTFIGLLLLFAGLAIAFPLIGHASWHAYKELASE
jgi:uncharacterized membrane protein